MSFDLHSRYIVAYTACPQNEIYFYLLKQIG